MSKFHETMLGAILVHVKMLDGTIVYAYKDKDNKYWFKGKRVMIEITEEIEREAIETETITELNTNP